MENKTMPDVARKLAESGKESASSLHETSVTIGDTTCVVSEDAFQYLESEWTKARKNYDLQSSGTQKALAQVTLLALGIEAGLAEHKPVIGRMEILQGWNNLQVCGIGEFPHQCIGKAIVERQMDYLGRKDLVGDALRESALELDLDIKSEHLSVK